MSKEDMDGVWRTIRGRRIFIGKGEDLSTAMKKSGKFNDNGKLPKRENIREARESISVDDRMSRADQHSHEARMSYNNKEKADHLNRKADKDWHKIREKNLRFSNSVYDKDRQAEKNRNNAEVQPLKQSYIGAKTRVERNYPRYSQAEKRELKHEALQKKLADYRKKKGIKTSITSEEYNKRMNDAYKELGKTGDYKKYWRRKMRAG